MKNISKFEIVVTIVLQVSMVTGGSILVSWLTYRLFDHRIGSSWVHVATWFFLFALGITYQVRPKNPLSMNLLGENRHFFWWVTLLHWLLIVSIQ